MKNAWRECANELAAAEAAWFDGDNHQKYYEWVHNWTAFVRMNLLRTADEVDEYFLDAMQASKRSLSGEDRT